ncbi:PfkB family carbohydrate kinase [Rhizobium mayense]|uniref:PfkB family carbohydrate kinase n=1 Tax=Rhizobium mayense TaxID=1312184 RepID=A0ABT7K279_9HYPH|nr:PfkB family carbohydrate kinase [Rhizobium mayense]MDL2402078.1 PfkB family carbohydrate kinase [Rhizobium mayense]
MKRVAVIGSVNRDRVWYLNEPLKPGSRLRYSRIETHLGGGAFYTGLQMLDLGAEVSIVARLMDDNAGTAILSELTTRGFDCSNIGWAEGETEPLEILLEPNGERTIISKHSAGLPALRACDKMDHDAVYINAVNLADSLSGQLDNIPLVISQMPLRKATLRPSDIIISSKADVAGELAEAWQRAKQVGGDRLKTLVLTDGPSAITIFDGVRAIEVEPKITVATANSIGAGDRFAGALLFFLLDGHSTVTATEEACRVTAEWLESGR